MSNYKRTVFYIGVTSDICSRLIQHKSRHYKGFTKKYNCIYLVYYIEYDSIEEAIRQEKRLKRWHRSWKINLIKEMNPGMKDLSTDFLDARDILKVAHRS